MKDREIIEDGDWLSDNIIFAAEQLLRQQYPQISGLQDPSLQMIQLLPVMGTKEFIQILHSGSNHWITISTVGCTSATVNVYDCSNGQLPNALQQTVADLLHTDFKCVTVNYVKVQYQIGSCDCGLFAIAFAHAICQGQDPGHIIFDQDAMRGHLLQAIDAIYLTPFHQRTRTRMKVQKKQAVINVYCVCRMPDDGTKM